LKLLVRARWRYLRGTAARAVGSRWGSPAANAELAISVGRALVGVVLLERRNVHVFELHAIGP
jgi:hypothetical protein